MGGRRPHKRSGMFIVMANEFFDLGNKLFCAPKRASSYGLFRDMPEPALHLIEP